MPHSKDVMERRIMPNKEFSLLNIDLIFLDHDKLELTVTPMPLMDSTRSKALWSNK